jgi:DNA-binding CsgD family transcriptional regulator
MVGHAHYWLAVHHFRTGEWDLTRRHLDAGLPPAAGFVSLTRLLTDARALLAAAEGDDDLLAALVEEGQAWAGPRHALGVLRTLDQAAGLGALGQGRYDEAFRRLAAISPPGTLAPHAQRALLVGLDLVEAAVRSGRPAEARAHAAVLADSGVAAFSPRLALVVSAAAALVEPDDAAAVTCFERALALPEVGDWPFDEARVRLALGERLRRGLAPADARVPLRAALATFERLGARPWADRARAELLATGETRAAPGDGPRLGLTAQERQVAELAARGLTNREIGARLHLSHRTVGSHLHHVFPKLGVTSRAALRDALNRAGPPPPRPPG